MYHLYEIVLESDQMWIKFQASCSSSEQALAFLEHRVRGWKDELSSSPSSCRVRLGAKRTAPKRPVPAGTHPQRPGKTSQQEPVVCRSRKAASKSLTATPFLRKHPQSRLTTHTKTAGSTNRPGTGPLSAGSTTGTLPKNTDKGSRTWASDGTAPS